MPRTKLVPRKPHRRGKQLATREAREVLEGLVELCAREFYFDLSIAGGNLDTWIGGWTEKHPEVVKQS